jgi:hypothetical protein
VISFIGEADVRNPYSEQPAMVRFGCIVAFGAFVIFGAYVPAALAISVIVGIGTSDASAEGIAGALAFCFVMAAVGAWTNGRYLHWLRGGRLSTIGWCCFNATSIICCAGIAWGSAAVQHWQFMFAAALIATLLGLVFSWGLVVVGQALAHR